MSRELARKSVSVTGRAWKKLDVNSILYGDDKHTWWISYNPSSRNTFGAAEFFYADSDTDEETALVKNNKFYILNGDWRKEYEAIIDKGFSACKRFFFAHLEHKSGWSNHDL